MAFSHGINSRCLMLLPLLGIAVPPAEATETPKLSLVSFPGIGASSSLMPTHSLRNAALQPVSSNQPASSNQPVSSNQVAPQALPGSSTSRLFSQTDLPPGQYLAQVVPSPGTTNTRVSTDIGGNYFEIDGGRQAGGNLFHRFEQLDLTTGQIANFLSNSTIENIFSQVAGSTSSIDGTIQVTGSGADLFLINPAGIILGPNARLDLSGSLTATTATSLGFGEQWIDLLGDGFKAETAIAESLTALEFAGAGGAIANQGQLTVPAGKSIGLLGHAVLNTGSLSAPGGKVTLAAAEVGQRLSLNGGLLNLDLETSPDETARLPLQSSLLDETFAEATGLQIEPDGTIVLEAGTALLTGEVDVSAMSEAGGQVKLLGNALTVVESIVDASGSQGGEILIGGDYQGQGDLLRAQSTQLDSASVLRADAGGMGDGGRIVVWAEGATQFAGMATATAQDGQGGLVETSGKQFLDIAGAQVNASSLEGNPGEWLLDPTDIVIQAGGSAVLTAGSFDPATTGAASTIAPATIETALDGGTNVVLTTTSGTGGNGDITLDDPINQTGGGSASLTLAGRRFNQTSGAKINLTSTGGLTFNLNQVNGEVNSSTQSIQAAIDSIGAVNGPRLITLGPGSYTEVTSADLITINTDLTIDGLDRLQSFISGSNNARVISVEPGVTATLRNLNIQDGQTAASGAGILNQGNLSLSNVLLQNNVAGLDGGAIDSSAVSSSLTTEADTDILNNQAGRNGGGLALGGNSQLDSGAILGNVAANDGGGLYNTGLLNLTNLGISQNDARRGGAVANIGSAANVAIQSFAIQDNDATLDGGGIFNDLGTVVSLNGSFNNNTSGRNGGGLWSTGPTSMRNTGFNSNQATSAGGGAFLFTTTLDSQALSFQNNQADADGGGLRLSETVATIADSDFLNNQAEFGGGLEASNSGSVTLDRVTFFGNVASRLGGALQNDDAVVLVANDSVFNNNRADFHGGAINNSGTLTLNNGFFLNNRAALDGGAIRNFSDLTINQGSFRDNVATRYGGAIYNSALWHGDGVTFKGNQAVAGGAIHSELGRNEITASLFQTNAVTQGVTSGDGGAIYVNQSEIAIDNSTFDGNQATDFGGAIASSDSTVSIERTIFANNQARLGGALQQNLGDLKLSSVALEENQASEEGGALQQVGGRLAIANSRFVKNVAQQRGGGIALDNVVDGTIDNSLIQGNQAIQNGGGGIVLSNSTNLTLNRTTFQQNQAQGNGGALAAQTFRNFSGNVTIDDSSFEQNRSNANGGAIHFFPNPLGGQLDIERTTFNANQAQRAGALFTGDDATSVLRRSTLSDNLANEAAGAIRSSGRLALEHVTVSHNTSDADATGDGLGGGIWQEQGQVNLKNSIIAQNQVGNDSVASSADLAGSFQDLGRNLIGIIEGSTGLTSSSLLGSRSAPLNPLLGALGNYGGRTQTRPLLPGSPALDSATTTALSLDQRDVARVNAADIGAFESQGFVTGSPGGTPQSTEVNTAFPLPLSVAISSPFSEPVNGGQVEFSAPTSGASIASNQNPTSVTIAGGVAQLFVDANGIIGDYDVLATAIGVNPVAFALTNLPGPDPTLPIAPTLPTPTIPDPLPPTPSLPEPLTTIPIAPAPAVPAAPPELVPEALPTSVDLPTPAITPPVIASAPSGESLPEEPSEVEPPAFIEQPFQPSNFQDSSDEQLSQPLAGESILSFSSSEAVAKIDGDFSAQYASHWQAASTEGSPVAQAAISAGKKTTGNTLAATQELLTGAEAAHGVKSAVVYALFVPQDKASDEQFGQTQVASMALNRRRQTNVVRDDDLLMLVLVPSTGEPVQRLVDVTRQELMQQVRLFRMAVADPDDPWSYRPLAQQIQSWLFAPIESDLNRFELDHAMYALAPGLRAVPLAAMMDGDEFIIERYGISLIPSVDLLETDFGSSPPPPQTLAAGANEFERLVDLPAVEVELNAIANQRESVNVLFNQEFTKANLVATQNQSQAKMLHLATHGSFNAGDLGQSYLQFWDGQLTLDEISQMGWDDLELLILSACQTAISSPEAELGFAGLAAATGVESTIGSLWTVSDIGTLGMMAEFYGQLGQEPLRFEALRQTQLSMMRGETAIAHQQLRTERGTIDLPLDWPLPESGDFSHPFYWSGFTLVGNPWW